MNQVVFELEANPLISVIIPCYKGEQFIGEAIESVLAQTYQNFEIIVVDDGSPDDSVLIVNQYVKDSRVKYVYQENQGVAAARNRGIQKSVGACLVFLDQDDRLLPNAFEIGLRSLKDHSNCGFVFGQSYLTNAKGAPLIYASLERAASGEPSCDYEALIGGTGPTICPPSVILFRRSVVEQVGGFNPAFGMADDYDIYLNVVKQVPIHFHGAVIAAYRQHGENNSHHTLQMRDDVLKVMNAQKTYLAEHPQYQAAAAAGEVHWRYCFTVILIHMIVKHFFQGQWKSVFRLSASLVKLPTFPLSVVFYWLWWYKVVRLRLKVRSVQSTEQLLSLMQESYNYKTNLVRGAEEMSSR